MKFLTRRKLRSALATPLIAGGLLLPGAASAIGLLQAYQAALQNDQTYRSAFYDSEAGKENRAIGRSGLLPSIAGNYSFSQNRSDIETDATGLDGKPFKNLTHPKYLSRVQSVQLRQGLLNLEAIARYKQGSAQADAASARFDAQSQEMILRVSGAYFEVLYGDDQVALAQAECDMYKEQMAVNDRLFAQGEGTKTDMLETRARLELAEAKLIEARDNQMSARNTLSSLIGMEAEGLTPLMPDFRPVPAVGKLSDLKERALRNNPEVQALTANVEAARQEVNRAKAGHTPKVDFVASYSKNQSDTINTYNQDSTVRAIGVQVTIPLYQGGQVSAVSRQSAFSYEKAKADLAARSQKLEVDLAKDYNLMLSSASRIEALSKAVQSNKLLVLATEQSIKGGVRINLDLLNARQQLFSNLRDLAQARYGYLLAQMRVRSGSGELSEAEVQEVAAFFQ